MHISTNLNTSDQLDVLADFISDDKEIYGAGMSNTAITQLYQAKAQKGRCSFFDACYVNGNVNTLNRELMGQSNSTLITSPINVYADEHLAPAENREAHCNLLKNTLNAIGNCNKDFNKIFIPIGCQEEGMPGHNIALILEKGYGGYNATILDQMGGASYADTKAKIMEDLGFCALNINPNIKYNLYPMSYNRNDCASFTSLMSEFACDGENMSQMVQNTDNFYQRNGVPQIAEDVIDLQHEQDQDTLVGVANNLAEKLIKETYEVDNLSRLRGLSDVPTPHEVVYSRVKKYYNAKHSGQRMINANNREY